MVYIYPNTLQVSPANPYNTDQIAVSCYIGLDFFDNTGWPDPTRTYEYLLMRPASPTGTWVGAQIVATYDCWDVNCWEGMAGQEVSQIPNNPNANYGYLITFPAFNAPSPGSYELMAVDYGDYGKSTYDPTRTATFNLTVSQNPNSTPISTPITTSSGNTTSSSSSTCSSGDIICQLTKSQYFPYIIIGGAVLVFLIISKPSGGGGRMVIERPGQ